MAEHMDSQKWDLFQPLMENNDTWSYELKEHIERDISGSKEKTALSIQNEDTSSWIYPHKSYLEVKFKIVKANGTNYAATDNIAPICSATSLFETAQYLINGTVVESIDQSAHIANFVRSMLDYSDDYSRSIATNHLWYPDTSTGASDNAPFTLTGTATGADGDRVIELNDAITAGNDKDLLGTGAGYLNLRYNSTYNQGFASRNVIQGASNLITVFIPLGRIFPFVNHTDRCFIGANHKINFTRISNDEFIHRDADADAGKIEIHSMSWWCPVLTPSIALEAQLSSQIMKKQTANIVWESVSVRILENVTAGQTAINNFITTQNERPTKVIFLLRNSATDRNNQLSNAYKFPPNNIVAATLQVGSKTFPDPEYNFSFDGSNPDAGRLMAAIHKVSLKNLDYDTGSQLNISNIKNLYGFITFDLSDIKPDMFDTPQSLTYRARYSGAGVPADSHLIAVIFHEKQAALNMVDGRMMVTQK